MDERQMNQVEAAFEVLARAIGMQEGIDKLKLARDIEANIPSATMPNICTVYCLSMARALTSDDQIQSAKPQFPARQPRA